MVSPALVLLCLFVQASVCSSSRECILRFKKCCAVKKKSFIHCSAQHDAHHLGFSHFSFFDLTSTFGLHSHLVCSVKLS